MKSISKLTKLTVSQINLRLKLYRERAKPQVLNPEEDVSDGNTLVNNIDLHWVTSQ